MRVAIATVRVPFLSGGAEVLADGLLRHLRKRGLQADLLSIPFKWYPPECLSDSMFAGRLLDLTETNGKPIDRLITLKFPAYYAPHPNKTLWLLHQHRQAYDLYDTPHGDLHHCAVGQNVAREIKRWDNALLPEHQSLYTISGKVSDRLRSFNNLSSEPLYPPPAEPESFYNRDAEPYILAPGRFDSLKRQMSAIEAMVQVPEGLRLVFIGPDDGEYADSCRRRIVELDLENRVEILGIVDDEKKVDLYARCLALYNGVYDEDYGYVTIEGFLSSKPVVAFTDSGGPLEFIQSGENGIVVPPESEPLSQAFSSLCEDYSQAARMGRAGRSSLEEKGIDWETVIDRLLS